MRKLQFMFAKWFGHRVIGVDLAHDKDFTVETTGYWFRGKLYIVKIEIK